MHVARRDSHAARHSGNLDPAQPFAGAAVRFGHRLPDRKPPGILPPDAGLATCTFEQFELVSQRGIGRSFSGRYGKFLTILCGEPKICAQAVENLGFGEVAHAGWDLCERNNQLTRARLLLLEPHGIVSENQGRNIW